MHNHHRYILAAAMISGDRQARFILADLLEEEGDTELAKYARQMGSRADRLVELTIMLLPWQEAIGLAIDFVEVAFDAHDWTITRRWLAGEVSNEVMIAYLRGPLAQDFEYIGTPLRKRTRDWSWDKLKVAQRVHLALRSAISEIAFCSANDPRVFHENESRLWVRRVVIRTSHYLRKTRQLEHWPHQHTIETLRQLMLTACPA